MWIGAWGASLYLLSLSHFSILGAVRTWGFMVAVLLRGSLKQTVCFTNSTDNPIIKFWSCLFVLSKIIELGE